jgi:hypothetical protein
VTSGQANLPVPEAERKRLKRQLTDRLLPFHESFL